MLLGAVVVSTGGPHVSHSIIFLLNGEVCTHNSQETSKKQANPINKLHEPTNLNEFSEKKVRFVFYRSLGNSSEEK